MKKGRCLKRKVFPSFSIVLKMKSSCMKKCKCKHKRKSHCKAQKRCCGKRGCKRRMYPVFLNHPKRCRRRHSFPIPFPAAPCCTPVTPVTPVIPVNPVKPCHKIKEIVIEKECCGNVLFQGKQPEFLIWEADVDSQTTIAQVSVFSNATSTDALNVDINGEEQKRIVVLPGNTSNFIGQDVKSVKVSVEGNDFTYVEGKYVISTTLQLPAKPPPMNGH